MATPTESERITRLEAEMDHVATKADLAAVRTDIETVRTDLERVRTDMALMQASLIKWMAGVVVGLVLSLGLGIANLLVTVLAN